MQFDLAMNQDSNNHADARYHATIPEAFVQCKLASNKAQRDLVEVLAELVVRAAWCEMCHVVCSFEGKPNPIKTKIVLLLHGAWL